MIDFVYLRRGLIALSRAHRANGMAGHLGSALMAGYFFGEIRADLKPGVRFAIERDLERIIGGEEAIWFNAEKTGVTIDDLFAPAELKAPDAAKGDLAAGVIAEALAKNIDKTRQSGHNTIFASIAIRGLRDHPEFGAPEVVEGLRKLMATFDNQGPGRAYFGEKVGWKNGNDVDVDPIPEPDYDTLAGLVDTTLDELIATASQPRTGFGGLHHLIDHAAALVELNELGFPDLAERGIAAHRHHLRLMRAIPELLEEKGPMVKAEKDFLDPEYWERRDSVQYGAWLTHRIKSLYGFTVLANACEDETKVAKATQEMRYLLA